MLKQLLLSKKIEQARSEFELLTQEDTILENKREELRTALEEVETEEDTKIVEDNINKLETEETELEEKKTKLKGEIETLEAELEELKSKAPTNNNERKEGEKMEIRQAIGNYVRSKGQERAGFTSVEGGALIPEELLKPQETPEDEMNLARLVNVVSVNSGAGKYPVIKHSEGVMSTTAELVANPELAKPAITEVLYDIDTYRGYIPVSQEVIDDADYPVTDLIVKEIKNQERNTKNNAIAAVLKTATAKAITGLDGIKGLKNKDLKKVYAGKFIVTASLYNELDTIKDKDGKYILQSDITVDSGMRLLGKECQVLDDTMLGADGALVGFYGDPKAFMTLFDRKSSTVKWIDNNVYGELLAGFVRFDAKKVDDAAGFFFTYTAAV